MRNRRRYPSSGFLPLSATSPTTTGLTGKYTENVLSSRDIDDWMRKGW